MEEIKLEDLNPEKFIEEKVNEISDIVGDGIAMNALSGGVDSSVVTMLGHRALGDRLKTYFIDTGLMREDEPEYIVSLFEDDFGVHVGLIDAEDEFFNALKGWKKRLPIVGRFFKGITDPEEKREAVTQTFYRDVFGKLVKESGAKYLLQGTNYTDIEETVAGIKRQHNIFEQIGINPEEAFGYNIVEPLVQLRKSGVREIAKAIGLPREIYKRIPFPGPGLATRIIGEVTPERVDTIRAATTIVEEELRSVDAFQYLAILHKDKVTGKRDEKRDFGQQIEVRCWSSEDGKIAEPTWLSYGILKNLGQRITKEVPGVVSVTYNITDKPPSTIEAI